VLAEETGMTPRVQVVVAHPDDETFGCGSVLLYARAAGAETAVSCATRGEAGEAPAGIDPAQLAATRAAELHSAATLLGVGHVDLLSFTDSGMSGEASVETLAGAPFDAVVESVRSSIEAFGPDVVVTLDASDGHRDHVRIRDATLAAAGALGVPRVYLQCLPRSLMRRWADRMAQERPEMEHLAADVAALGTPDEDLTTIIDTSRHLTTRELAIAVHASQVSPYAGLPDDLRTAFLATDHLRRVVPAWTGGARESALLP
jgi:LmbE family N-acetylglucosaminyl deacetylase